MASDTRTGKQLLPKQTWYKYQNFSSVAALILFASSTKSYYKTLTMHCKGKIGLHVTYVACKNKHEWS